MHLLLFENDFIKRIHKFYTHENRNVHFMDHKPSPYVVLSNFLIHGSDEIRSGEGHRRRRRRCRRLRR